MNAQLAPEEIKTRELRAEMRKLSATSLRSIAKLGSPDKAKIAKDELFYRGKSGQRT